jgi:3-oxoadipate:acetyl-CoA acetyltransferase
MTKPCIICVAITGSLPRKANNPAVPITLAEQVEGTHEAFEAGASILHAHVRNDDETPSSDPEKFARLKEEVEKHCPGMIIQFSTGGRSGAERDAAAAPQHGVAVSRVQQLPDPRLREPAISGGLGGR